MARVRLCSLEEAPPPGKGRHCEADGGAGIALFNDGGRFFAVRDNCPHMDAPLHDAILARGVITCRWHGWQFELSTGVSLMSERICVDRYPVIVQDGAIWAQL
jgi:nitrite reductase (NADH) small subunit